MKYAYKAMLRTIENLRQSTYNHTHTITHTQCWRISSWKPLSDAHLTWARSLIPQRDSTPTRGLTKWIVTTYREHGETVSLVNSWYDWEMKQAHWKTVWLIVYESLNTSTVQNTNCVLSSYPHRSKHLVPPQTFAGVPVTGLCTRSKFETSFLVPKQMNS